MKLRKTKRLAPNGFIAIDKPSAKRVFEHGEAVTIAGNNVNSYHIFNGWSLGCTVVKGGHEGEYGNNFESILGLFMFRLDRELGTYPVFYIKQSAFTALEAQ